MYKMPLIYVFGRFGVGASIFCIGVLGNGILSLAFYPEIMELLSIYMKFATTLLPFKSASYWYGIMDV